MLEDDLSKLHETPKAEVRPIWEVTLDNIEAVSSEEFSKFPHDGATKHDRYLYSHL